MAAKDDPLREEALREKYGGTWSEHPFFPLVDWQAEVANNETRQGYWSFVESAVWNQIDDLCDEPLEEILLRVDDETLCQEAKDHIKRRLAGNESPFNIQSRHP